jgi:hypothetical protein
VIRAAHAAAAEEGSQLTFSHLETVIEANANFETDFRGAGEIANMASYM